MFSVVSLRRSAQVDVVPNDNEFRKRFDFYVHRFDLSSKELEKAHFDCDGRLISKLHAVIEPVLGPEGSRAEPWHHNLDFYGDGVRSLEVDATRFPSTLIEPLLALLVGEQERFCILVKYYESLAAEPARRVGALALFHSRIIMTRSLLSVLEHA